MELPINKREFFLILITVVLVIVLGIGFYYDRTSALLDRTNAVKISQDQNLQLQKINKTGFLFARAAYEAKFRIVNNQFGNYVDLLSVAYGGGGGFCGMEGYKQYEEQALTKVSIKPQPKSDALIWILGSKLGNNTEKSIVYIIDEEVDGNVYLYVYYSRK